MNLFLRLSCFRKRLVKIGEKESLSKLSLFVLIALDIYILSIIFTGLSDHTRQLKSPEEFIPYQCREIFINNNWNRDNYLDEIQRLVLADYNNYSYYYESILQDQRINKMHAICRSFFLKIKGIKENADLHQLFLERQKIQKSRRQKTGSIKNDKAIYDTSLLQSIAENKEASDLKNVQGKVKKDFQAIESIDQRLDVLKKKIFGTEQIKELLNLVEADSKSRLLLIKEYRRLQFIYPLKKICWQMLFIFPLIAVFYFWSSLCIKRNLHVQLLISSHLLAVSSIPAILKVIELVLDLLPKHLFKKIFQLLSALHLVAIWHYLVIALSVLSALIVIYIIQKKIFSPEKIALKRLAKGECYSCGFQVKDYMQVCPACGVALMKNCSSCDKQIPVKAKFCIFCGANRS